MLTIIVPGWLVWLFVGLGFTNLILRAIAAVLQFKIKRMRSEIARLSKHRARDRADGDGFAPASDFELLHGRGTDR